MTDALPCILPPLLAAALLLVPRVAASARGVAVLGVLGPLLSLLAAGYLAWSAGAAPSGVAWLPLPDRLAAAGAVLVAGLALAATAVTPGWAATRRREGWTVPAAHAAALQGGLALSLVALLPGMPAPTVAAGGGLVLLEVAGAAAGGVRARVAAGRAARPVLAAVLLGLLGATLLPAAAGGTAAGAGWSGLAGAGTAVAGALLLCGLLALAGLAPLHGSAGVVASPAAVLCGLLRPPVALVALLRLRVGMEGSALPPGPLLLGAGLLSVLLAAGVLAAGAGRGRAGAGGRARARVLDATALGGAGVVAVAFGLGGAGAVYAGVLHLLLQGLAQAAARLHALPPRGTVRDGAAPDGAGHGGAPSGGVGRASLLLLSGLLPAGPFCSAALVLLEVVRHAAWAAVPLALGLVVGGVALLGRAAGAAGARRGGGGVGGLVPAGLLLLSVLLSLCMPPRMADWLIALSGTPLR